MNYLLLGNLGSTEILVLLFILLGPMLGLFFLGYYLGKNSAKKKNQ